MVVGTRMPEWLRIIALAMAGAIGYGIVHDQITIRISLEYFTVGHPRIIPSDDPTLVALAWGIVATWWTGLLLGLLLAAAARAWAWPRVPARDLVRPLLVVLLVTALGAALNGWTGIFGPFSWEGPSELSKEKADAYLVAYQIHSASYLVGIVAGCALVARVILRRWRLRQAGRMAAARPS